MPSAIRKSSFVGGAVAPPLHARVDLAAYAAWLKVCKNFVIRPFGGARNRPGTQLSVRTKDNQRVMLVPFVFNQNEAYILEFGSEYVRFVRDGAQIKLTDHSPLIASNDKSPADSNLVLTTQGIGNPSLFRSQGFMSTASGPFSLSEVRVKMLKAGGVCPVVRVAIYTDLAGVPNAAVPGLDFNNFAPLQSDSLGADYAFASFPLADPEAAEVELDPSIPYHIVVRSDSDVGFAGKAYIAATTAHAYDGGVACTFYSADWQVLDGFDLCFEVDAFVAPGAVVEVDTTYQADEVLEIKGRTAQSADVLFIPHHNHKPAELRRIAEQSWQLRDLNTEATILAPTLTASDITGDEAGDANNPSKSWWYVVTAIDSRTGAESFGSVPVNVELNISAIEPATVTLPAAVNGASGYNVYRGRNYGVYGYVGTMIGLEYFDDGLEPDYTTCPIADPSTPVATDPVTPTPVVVERITGGHNDDMTVWYFGVTAVGVGGDESFPSEGLYYAFSQVPFPVEITVNLVPGATSYKLYRGLSRTRMGLVLTSATNYRMSDPGSAPDYDTLPPVQVPNQAPGAPPIRFIAPGDYPSCAAFKDQRLILAGTDNKPDTFFGSRTGDYRNFNAASPAGDSDAFEWTLGALTVDRILGLIHMRDLLQFTASSEWVVKGSKEGGLSANSVDAKAHAHNGSGDLAPLPCGGRVLFAQGEGQAIREFRYDFAGDGYTADDDRSILANHFLDGHTIIDWAYAKSPDSVVWMVRDDGVLLGMTYLPQHEVIAWHEHETDGLVESVACIPENGQTATYIAVARTVGGETVRFIERLAPRFIEDIKDSVFLDCSLTYRGTDVHLSGVRVLTFDETLAFVPYLIDTFATVDITGQNYFVDAHVGTQLVLTGTDGRAYQLTITSVYTPLRVGIKFEQDLPASLQGSTTSWAHAQSAFVFDHMIGETVSALVDGNVVPDLVVDEDGNVTLPHCGVIVTIGKPYVSELETLDINVDGRSVQTNQKVTGKVWIDYVKSRGLWVGEDREHMTEWKQKLVADNVTTPMSTGRDYINIKGGWRRSGTLVVQQRDPLPLELTAITPEVTFGG